jgi:hypothetical protein
MSVSLPHGDLVWQESDCAAESGQPRNSYRPAVVLVESGKNKCGVDAVQTPDFSIMLGIHCNRRELSANCYAHSQPLTS